ncbi:protoporphyrinogen oxidase [soil metagenome]
MPARVLVIGAGISGLAAAVELKSRGVDVRVLEASDRAGGPIFTEYHDGFTIDAGPDSFLSTKPGGLWFADRLGIVDQIVSTRPDGGGTFIVHDSQMQPLPEGITMLVPTQFRQILESPLLDLKGKLRLLADYFIPARSGDDDESVANFMRRRVGQQAFERLADPLLSGIFAGDAEKLSILSTFPRLREAERRHGGLIRAGLAARRSAANSPQPAGRHTPFVSIQGGLGSLIRAAIQHIGSQQVIFNCPVETIDAIHGGYRVTVRSGNSFEADGIVIATPAYAAAMLLAGLAPSASAQLATIPHVSSATVSMAFNESDISVVGGGRGFVVPRVEGFDLTAATWSSRKFAGRAPAGKVLLRGFVGRAGNEGPAFLPDDQLIEVVRRDLAAITGISAEPLFARIYRSHNGMPQYHVGHNKLVQEIETLVAWIDGLSLVGAAYRGVGIPDCVAYATGSAARLSMQFSVAQKIVAS